MLHGEQMSESRPQPPIDQFRPFPAFGTSIYRTQRTCLTPSQPSAENAEAP